MLRTRRSGGSGPASALRVLHRLPALYVALLAWALTAVADDVIPTGMIARLMLVVGIVVALYAATAALVVYLACGRFGIVRQPQWRRRAAATAIASACAWILASAWQEGRSTLNVFAIATVELAGVALCLSRRPLLAAASARLRIQH